MSEVKVGNKVPLGAQVECPDGTPIFIRAFIKDSNDVLLTTRDMIDRGNGKFENFSYTMPNEDILSVQYLSFDDATYTTQIDEPCPGTEIFTKLEEITGGGSDSSGVRAIGKIISGIIIGKVVGQKILKGSISNNTVKGIVQGQSLIKGKILNSVIKGRIICKK